MPHMQAYATICGMCAHMLAHAGICMHMRAHVTYASFCEHMSQYDASVGTCPRSPQKRLVSTQRFRRNAFTHAAKAEEPTLEGAPTVHGHFSPAFLFRLAPSQILQAMAIPDRSSFFLPHLTAPPAQRLPTSAPSPTSFAEAWWLSSLGGRAWSRDRQLCLIVHRYLPKRSRRRA